MTPSIFLRTLLVAFIVLVSLSLASAEGRKVTDIAGRTVELPQKVERVILGEGRFLPVLAILETDDPARRVVGMMADFERLDPDGYAAYVARFPKIGEIFRIGMTSEQSFSLEQAIALRPDVAIFGLEGHGPSARAANVISALEAAGAVVVFVDFRQKPLEHAEASMQILGTVLGRQERAEAFLKVYREGMAAVADRLGEAQGEAQGEAPSLFLESRVGLSDECCETMGAGMLGEMAGFAGARNMGTDLLPGVAGNVSLEYLLSNQPDIYLATGIGNSRSLGSGSARVALGAGISEEVARASLRHSLQRTGIAELTAVREGRAYAIWHHFYNTPLHVAAVQRMAKWFRPDLFADLDPEATLEKLYEEFQPVPLSGVYWVGL